MIQCEYLGRNFGINKKMLKQLQAVELKSEIDYNEQDTAGGLPLIEIKGYKPQSLSIGYMAITGAGVNPYEEYTAWKKKLGKAGEFFIGSEQLGVDVFTLKSVSLTGGKIDAKGRFVSGNISISLTQDIAAKG